MVDVANVGLVDAHPEGDRRDDDAAIGRHPAILDGAALLALHARVIGLGRVPAAAEQLGDALGGLLQRDVDDGRPRRARGEARQERVVALGAASPA